MLRRRITREILENAGGGKYLEKQRTRFKGFIFLIFFLLDYIHRTTQL